MRFNSVIDWLSWQEKLHPAEIELGLDRVDKVYSGLCSRNSVPFTITVGGTNGKGSTSAFLQSILGEAGFRVGCYSSPHLVSYNERIVVNGRPVSDTLLCEAFQAVDTARGKTSLSYFEFGTLAALWIFEHEKVDFKILEVGLGGRLDATNVVDADIAVITSIDIDHVEWLGDSREQIGYEKAGIFRPGKPAIVGEPDLPHTVKDFAKSIGARLVVSGRDFSFATEQDCWNWQGVSSSIQQLPMPSLSGGHQIGNAATAVAVIDALADKFEISPAVIRKGLENASLPGRLQWLDDGHRFLLDVAHNPESAAALAEFIHSTECKGKRYALFSMMADKDVESIINALLPAIDCWFWVPLPSVQRSINKEKIEKAFLNCGIEKIETGASDFEEALCNLSTLLEEEDQVFIFGSFFLASEVLSRRELITAISQ